MQAGYEGWKEVGFIRFIFVINMNIFQDLLIFTFNYKYKFN